MDRCVWGLRLGFHKTSPLPLIHLPSVNLVSGSEHIHYGERKLLKAYLFIQQFRPIFKQAEKLKSREMKEG